MTLFGVALGLWLVAVPFGLIKPSKNDEEFIVIRKR